MKPNVQSPKVFISYSWTSQEYQAQIVEIAERLVSHGVKVILDEWDLSVGHDKFEFMERMVTDPDVAHVLLMCDKRYTEKADSRDGGVGTETQIVSKEVYDRTNQEKFIPIVMQRDDQGKEYVPAYLSSRIFIDFSNTHKFAEEYEKLLRIIFKIPKRSRPAIGTPPSFLTSTSAASPNTHILLSRTSLTGNTPEKANTSARRIFKSILADLRGQQLISLPTGNSDEIILSNIQGLKELRNATVVSLKQLMTHESDEEIRNEIVYFFEQVISIADWPKQAQTWQPWRADHLWFFARETWLYAIAILIEEQKWTAAKMLLETTLCAVYNQKFGPVGYHVIERYSACLEEDANKKKNPRRVSVVADLIKERADDRDISFELLMQADYILCLRCILAHDRSKRWWPRTLVFAQDAFPIFVRWRASQMLPGIIALLAVPDREAIYKGLQQAGSEVLSRYKFDIWDIDFIGLADLHDIAEADRASR